MIMILSQFINGMRSSSKKSRFGITNVLQGNTVDEKILHQLISSFFPSIYKVLYIPGGAGFLPLTVCSVKKKILDGIHLLPIPHIPTILAQRKIPLAPHLLYRLHASICIPPF